MRIRDNDAETGCVLPGLVVDKCFCGFGDLFHFWDVENEHSAPYPAIICAENRKRVGLENEFGH